MQAQLSLFTSLRYDPQLRDGGASTLSHAGWNLDNASPFYMLDLHRDRLVRAACHWRWDKAVETLSGSQGLQRMATQAEKFLGQEDAPLRLRVTVTEQGTLDFHKDPTAATTLTRLFPSTLPPPAKSPLREDEDKPYILVLDNVSSAKSEETHFKTNRRHVYNAARERAGLLPSDLKEVLLVNEPSGTVMDGSITTPYFWRGGRWVTPPVADEFVSSACDAGQDSGGQDGTSRRWALER